MRPDRATRSFLLLMTVASLIGAFALCGVLGVVAPLLLARVSHDGPGALMSFSGLLGSALLLLGAASLGLGARSLVRHLLASRRLAEYMAERSLAPTGVLAATAAHADLDGRLVFVDSSERFSFVYGLVRPQVALSRGLVAAASAEELEAVLTHELYHARNLDPLKIVLTRSLVAALFFLPSLGALQARYRVDCELAADRWAIARCGDRALAGALAKTIGGPSWNEQSGAVGIGGNNLLDIRVLQLETGSEPRVRPIGSQRAALSILVTALLAAAYVASVQALGVDGAVNHVTGGGLARATLVGGLQCTIPLVAVGCSLCVLIALQAKATGTPLHHRSPGSIGHLRRSGQQAR
jgi:beta-lactamase regulating signal transducer with metallopeptidase domain